jgi:4-hydroxybenzoate polyprenyltransferase
VIFRRGSRWLIFTLGVFAMRAAGCAINDYADRNLDPQVARTAGRPIAAGRVTPREALIVFAALLVFAFLLVLLTNPLTIKLSFIGAALGGAVSVYQALHRSAAGRARRSIRLVDSDGVCGDSKHVPPVGWLLFIANILWSVIYDTEYAMVDRDDDLKAGARSTAILFGDADVPIIGVLMGTFVVAMVMVGTRALEWPYWLASPSRRHCSAGSSG